MESTKFVPKLSVYYSTITCFILSLIYVGSLYIWRSDENRDHPSTVKKRFMSVSMAMAVSPFFVYYLLCTNDATNVPLYEIMGFRLNGLGAAISIPLLLTALLFLGPLTSNILNEPLKSYSPSNWIENVRNILWIRNHIMAPLSEEFTFRACMMPLLLQSFTPMTAVFLTPLFFGVAHLHHNIERVRFGMDVKTACIISVFQFAYTGIFGIYSAFLFARTAHFAAPFIAHAFCNHMGFPPFHEVLSETTGKKIIICISYVIGLIGWIYLLPLVTEPAIYSNELYWK